MTTVAELIERVNRLKYQLALFETMVNHLNGYVGTETAPSIDSIQVQDVGVVPSDVIENEIDLLRARIEDAQDQLARIQKMEIADEQNGNQEDHQDEGTAASPKAGEAKPGIKIKGRGKPN